MASSGSTLVEGIKPQLQPLIGIPVGGGSFQCGSIMQALKQFLAATQTAFQTTRKGHVFLLTAQNLSAKSSNRYSDNDGDGGHKNGSTEDFLQLYKSKGQHLLTNVRILDAIVRKSDVRPTDTVLEIGPGTGNLTLKLLQVANKVIAIEIDKRMVDILQKRAAQQGLEDGLHIINKDAMKTEFPQFDLVVANIPYGISSPLVAKLVYGCNPFRSATLLLQKEFARRLLAKPGESQYNRLAVNVKLVADVEFVMDVSKREFLPCPKVDSSVVIIRPKDQVPDVNLDEWWAFTRTCFCKKNKTLGATFKQKKKVMELLRLAKGTDLSNEFDTRGNQHHSGDENSDIEVFDASPGAGLEISLFKDRIVRILEAGGFADKRPSKLSNEELLHLLSLFNQSGIYFHNHVNITKSDDVEFSDAYS